MQKGPSFRATPEVIKQIKAPNKARPLDNRAVSICRRREESASLRWGCDQVHRGHERKVGEGDSSACTDCVRTKKRVRDMIDQE